MNNYAYLGVVRGASFDVLAAEDARPGTYRLTAAVPGEDVAPEGDEIRLTDYDQRALLVRGIGRDGWIYAATIVEEAGAILTLVVSAAFSNEPGSPPPTGLVFPGG